MHCSVEVEHTEVEGMPHVRNKTEQHTNEVELRKYEEYWRSITEDSPEYIIILDTDYTIRFINHSVPDLTEKEVIGKPYLDFIPPDYHKIVLDCFERVIKSGKPDRYETKYISVEGETQFFDVRISPLTGEEGNITGLVSISNNITERKKMEEALRESEERYRSLSEAAFEAIFISEKGVCLEQNPTAEKMFGYTSSEAIGRMGTEWIVPEDREMVMNNMLSGYEEPYEATALRKDGSTFPSEIQAKMMHYKGRDVRVTALNDITKRKHAEDKLKRSEERYRSIFESAANLITSIDSEGIIVDCNDRINAFLGYTKKEIIGNSMGKIIHPDYMEKAAESLNEILQTGFSYDKEYTMIKKDGELIDVIINSSGLNKADGGYERTICIINDITERKKAEKALRESDNKFRLIAERIFDVIFMADLDAVISYVSPSVERVFGYSPAELIGSNISKFVPVAVLPDVISTFQTTAQGLPVENVQSEFIKKNGSVACVEINALPIHKDGKIVGAQAIVHDITVRKDTEKQLRLAQKMESVGRLAGGVAHDFNNMLGVILGHTEMALEQVDPDRPLYDHLTEIRLAAERSADLTRQLLAFARKQTVTPRVLNLNEIVGGMHKMLQRLIGEDIDLSWLPGGDLWSIRMDPSQIDQIMANLCVNARDAIAGVGVVTIDTANTTPDEAYCADYPGFVPGEYVLLSISDDGCGMDKEILGNLFEPFFTTKGIGEGTGLGLSMVYGIVKQNDGFIYVQSEPGQGTTFKIYLPRYEVSTAPIQSSSTAKPLQPGHETILLVEDEPAILHLTKMMLEQHGYKVLVALTPGEAIRLAGELQGEINLLITDVVMPQMNGRDLAKKLLSVHPNIKRLFMSGYTADVIAHHGVLDEGVHFIQKPFTNQDLAVKVHEALYGERGKACPPPSPEYSED